MIYSDNSNKENVGFTDGRYSKRFLRLKRNRVQGRVVYNFGICQIVQIGKNLGFNGSKTIIILAMFAKNRKIPALNLALHN